MSQIDGANYHADAPPGFTTTRKFNMAVCKYREFLEYNDEAVFDQIYDPGTATSYAGIYRCMGCHREIGIAGNHTLPPQGHHTHAEHQGPIRWRLAVWADHNPK